MRLNASATLVFWSFRVYKQYKIDQKEKIFFRQIALLKHFQANLYS